MSYCSFQSVFAPKLAPLEEEQRHSDVFEGNTATFECPVSNLRLEDLEIGWLQKGQPIDVHASRRYVVSLDGTRLTILGIHLADEGEYTCMVKNRAGQASAHFQLHVLIPPVVLGEQQSDLELPEGKELDLECIFDGQPKPEARWTKDGAELPAEAKASCLSISRFTFLKFFAFFVGLQF